MSVILVSFFASVLIVCLINGYLYAKRWLFFLKDIHEFRDQHHWFCFSVEEIQSINIQQIPPV